MTKTYTEMRAAAYFAAARSIRKVAALVLDEMQTPEELRNVSTLAWALNVARTTAEKANALETQGYEECITDGRTHAVITRSRNGYSDAIRRFEQRVLDAGAASALHEAKHREEQSRKRAAEFAARSKDWTQCATQTEANAL